MSVTSRQAFLLVGPLARSINWVPVGPAAVLGMVIVWLVARDNVAGLEEVIAALRAAAILLAVAAAFALDDSAANLGASAPSSLLVRSGIRGVIAGVAATVLWCGAVVIAVHASPLESTALPVAALTLEFATMVMLALCLTATVVGRNATVAGGPTAAAWLLGLTVVSWLVPEHLRPWVYPGQPAWLPTHRWWAVALGVTLAWFVWANLDAVRRRRVPRVVTVAQ